MIKLIKNRTSNIVTNFIPDLFHFEVNSQNRRARTTYQCYDEDKTHHVDKFL